MTLKQEISNNTYQVTAAQAGKYCFVLENSKGQSVDGSKLSVLRKAGLGGRGASLCMAMDPAS